MNGGKRERQGRRKRDREKESEIKEEERLERRNKETIAEVRAVLSVLLNYSLSLKRFFSSSSHPLFLFGLVLPIHHPPIPPCTNTYSSSLSLDKIVESHFAMPPASVFFLFCQ